MKMFFSDHADDSNMIFLLMMMTRNLARLWVGNWVVMMMMIMMMVVMMT